LGCWIIKSVCYIEAFEAAIDFSGLSQNLRTSEPQNLKTTSSPGQSVDNSLSKRAVEITVDEQDEFATVAQAEGLTPEELR
jgi:hypothetical protein